MSLSVVLDGVQRRLAADRLVAVAGGREWEGPVWSGTWIDPVTETLMLRPRCLDPEWYSQSTGVYAKSGLGEFVVGDGWEERADQHWAGPWLARRDSSGTGPAVSQWSLGKNRGVCLAWYGYGSGDTFLQLRCGWGPSADEGLGVSLRFWSDGRVEVRRDGVLVGEGKVSGARAREVRRLQVTEVLLLPMRRRELLVLSQAGDGFSVVMPGIDEDTVDPEITPAGKFWFWVASGGTQVQVAPVRFAPSGHATSLQTSFLEAPLAGEVLSSYTNAGWLASPAPYKVTGDPGFGGGSQSVSVGLVEWDGSTAFVPDGLRTRVRLRAELETTDEGWTPFVYGAQAGYGAVAGTTPGPGVDVATFVTEMRLSVADRAWGVVGDLSVKDPSGAGLGSGVTNRALLVSAGGSGLLDGRTGAVETVSAVVSEADAGRLEVRDAWKALENAVFAERWPLDGLTLEEAVRGLVSRSGVFGSSVVMGTSGVRLPAGAGRKAGDWSMLVEAGDSAAEWLRRLMETFAADWVYGFRPSGSGFGSVAGTEFYALPRATGSDPVGAVLYGSIGAAVGAGVPVESARGRVYRRLERTRLEPAANEVRVTGLDARTGRPVQAAKTDYGSQTVGLAAGARPGNWLGEIRRFTLVDAGLTEPGAVDVVCESLFSELTRSRELAEFESELLVGSDGRVLWRGDLVELAGLGVWSIRSFGARFVTEWAGGVYREAVYTVEKVS